MSLEKEIVIDGNEVFDFVETAINDKEANDIEFRNCDFSKEDILELSNNKEYERVAFVDCSFEDSSVIQNIKTKSLSFTDNKINSYDFIYNMTFLESLTVVCGKIDASRLSILKELQYLRISRSLIDNIDEYIPSNLKYLFIDGTNITDLSFINKCNNLEVLSISDYQESHNKELIERLSKQIKIIRDSIVEMEVNTND